MDKELKKTNNYKKGAHVYKNEKQPNMRERQTTEESTARTQQQGFLHTPKSLEVSNFDLQILPILIAKKIVPNRITLPIAGSIFSTMNSPAGRYLKRKMI